MKWVGRVAGAGVVPGVAVGAAALPSSIWAWVALAPSVFVLAVAIAIILVALTLKCDAGGAAAAIAMVVAALFKRRDSDGDVKDD